MTTFQWKEKYQLYKQYVQKENTNKISKYQTYEGVALGNWVHNVRTSYKLKKLSKDKIELMESISGWEWKIYKK